MPSSLSQYGVEDDTTSTWSATTGQAGNRRAYQGGTSGPMSELGTALEGLSTVDGASYIDDGGNGYDDDYEHGEGFGNDFGHGIEHACK